MRHSFPSQDKVMEAWLKQSSTHGYCKGNILFDGDTIYSFGTHFPIARLIGNTAFVTIGRYSVTTACHVGAVYSRLCNSSYVLFNVAHVVGERHLDNMRNYAARIAEEIGKAQRALKYSDSHWRYAEELRDEANRYATLFSPKVRVMLPQLTEADRLARAITGRLNVKRFGKVEAQSLVQEVA